jgi:NADH dehydrogenase FAD-containing subunit
MDHLRTWRDKIRDAHDIVLVGGGAVSIEYAGEIKDKYPNKKVTIVQKEDLLLNEAYPKSFRKDVAKSMRKRDIDLVLGDYIDNLTISEAGTIQTHSGKRLIADLVLPCRGPKPNTSFVTLAPIAISETKHIRVASTLQVFNYPRIFAGGDAIEWDEQKQVGKYADHASVIAANIVTLLKKKQPGALYHGQYEMIFLSNGKEGGNTYWQIFWGPQFGDWVSSHLKSKDLFLTWTRKSLGLSS